MTVTLDPVAPTAPPQASVGPLARALIAVIGFYRSAISPLRPAACRYRPTCSEYALEAVLVHGAVRGSWLGLRRLLRCHPFHAGGHDPVPPRVGRGGHRIDLPSTQAPPGAAREMHRPTAAGEE